MQSDPEFTPPPERRWRLLVCDDSPLERLALSHFLRGHGFTVDESSDGESAVQMLQLRQIDLIVLDLQMPGKDGFYVLSYLQKHRPGLPVVLLSGMTVDDIEDRIHLLPSRELPPLLLKPVDAIQLLELIDLELGGEMPDMPPRQRGEG